MVNLRQLYIALMNYAVGNWNLVIGRIQDRQSGWKKGRTSVDCGYDINNITKHEEEHFIHL